MKIKEFDNFIGIIKCFRFVIIQGNLVVSDFFLNFVIFSLTN